MPCRDYYDDHPQEYARQVQRANETKIDEQKRRLDDFARHLCFVCGALEKIGGKNVWKALKELPNTEEHGNAAAEIETWWIQHQKDDAAEAARLEAKRKAREEIKRAKAEEAKKRNAALAKLTKEERKALGLA